MKDYKLVFEENFDVDGAPNPEIWTHEVGEKWANNESQCYVDDREHSFVKDGKLNIIATCNEKSPCKYQSARINTKDKKHFMYAKFVVRAKMPKGRGAWPAIWFLGTTTEEKRWWPKCGEIDLLEYAGNRPESVSCAIHTAAYNHKINTDKGIRVPLADASDTFHDYILDWTNEYLSFQIDDQEIFRVDKMANDTDDEWPFDKPYYMILNLAVGGWYGGPIFDEDFPFHFQVDSIKVYQKI